MARTTRGASMAGTLALALACSIDLPAPQGASSDDGAGSQPIRMGEVPMMRLTRAQYVQTIADLFGAALPDDLDVRDELPQDDIDAGFAANTIAVSDTVVLQYELAAEHIAQSVGRAELHPCLATSIPEPSCATTFVSSFAPRAMRRALSDDELADLAALMDPPPARAEDADLAVRRVVTAVLQSPDFLYRIERGDDSETDDVSLTGFEIATRMSYLLWGSMPDAALTTDAASGRLRDPGYRDEVFTRMLADDRAAIGLAAMHRQWLQVDALDHLVKDRNVFPTFSEALGPELDAELAGMVDRVIRHDDGTLYTLLTSNETVGTQAVALWYGDDLLDGAPGVGGQTSVLTLDPTRRAGVLTSLAVLAAHAKPDDSDPVRRGALVRERLLCQPLAAPPPGVAKPPAAAAPGASLRERLELHTADPACAVCHDRIDPIGFALEGYDAMGGTRTHDGAGNQIDASAMLDDTDVDGPLDGGVALAHALARSEQVLRCYALQWFRHAVGRLETDDDAALIESIQIEFDDSGGHIPTLLRALVTSDAFIHRRRP